MTIANDVYLWWFWGLGGLGGWALFLLLAIAAATYVYLDSANRNIKAVGWRMGTLLPLILFVPTLLFRFTNPSRPIQAQASEWFMVVGILGTMISIAAAVGYAITYWDVQPQPQTPASPSGQQVVEPPPAQPQRVIREESPASPQSRRQPANAWLVDAQSGDRHSLYVGDTRIGRRRSGNDIVLDNPSVSREQALIREESGVFTLFDRGSTSGTFVNERRLREPAILYHGDVVDMGDLRLTFVSSEG